MNPGQFTGRQRVLALSIGIATVIKLWLALTTVGTNDVTYWQVFMDYIVRNDSVSIYRDIRYYNHPPMVSGLLALLHIVTSRAPKTLPFLVRLPSICADVVSALMVFRLVRFAWDERRGLICAVGVALSPILILVSGFHGNSDPVFTALILVAAERLIIGRSPIVSGLLLGLAIITVSFDLPLRLWHRRAGGDLGFLKSLWWTLPVAALCVLISRLADFQPGYLYGLIISIVFVTEISTRDEGIGTWLASVWLLVLSFGAWILLAFVRQGTFDPWVSLFLQTVLVTFVVAGIETLAVGLLPMRFLPGHPLYRWRRAMWFPLFALAIFGYLLILVDPANGYLSDDSRAPLLIGVIFLVVFGIVSLGTWAYFRFRPARVGGDRPGEAPAE